MKHVPLFVAFLCLTACGVETVSTAASSAALKKQELEAAQKIKQQAEQKTLEALQQAQKRSEEVAKENK